MLSIFLYQDEVYRMESEIQIWCDLYKDLTSLELNKRLRDVRESNNAHQQESQVKALKSLLKN